MRCTLLLAILGCACGDDSDGFSPPPVSPDTENIGGGGSAGPMGVMDAGEVTGDTLSTSEDTGGTAATLGTGTGGTFATETLTDSATSVATFATDITDSITITDTITATDGGAAVCDGAFEVCEGDGTCVTDLRTGQFVCSHGRAGEPCTEGALCDDGLVCLPDETASQFVCTAP